ncbi:hypothetical protein ON010_g12484 [Phytophthora cinnamomi]|nr:hypothetical protein ON010_g12484 [Phytophthora cinnamomi]
MQKHGAEAFLYPDTSGSLVFNNTTRLFGDGYSNTASDITPALGTATSGAGVLPANDGFFGRVAFVPGSGSTGSVVCIVSLRRTTISGTTCPVMASSASGTAPNTGVIPSALATASGTITVAWGSRPNVALDLQLSASLKNVKYVALLLFAETWAGNFASATTVQQWQFPFNGTPWTVQPGFSIRNPKLKIGSQNGFDISYDYDFQDFCNEFSKLSTINGAQTAELSNGLLDNQTWQQTNRVYYYVKPGCTVKAGKKGVDYFHGENALLDYVCADVDFFPWSVLNGLLGVFNLTASCRVCGARGRDTVTSEKEDAAEEEEIGQDSQAKGKASSAKTQNIQRSAKTKKKKLLKKQLREQEDKRRRKMSSFRRFGLTYPKKWRSPPTADDQEVSASSSGENASVEDPEVYADFGCNAEPKGTSTTMDGVSDGDPDYVDSSKSCTESSVRSIRSTVRKRATADEGSVVTASAIAFGNCAALDPNLLLEDSSVFLGSDVDGSGDELTAQDEYSPNSIVGDSESESNDDGGEEPSIDPELQRVNGLLSDEQTGAIAFACANSKCEKHTVVQTNSGSRNRSMAGAYDCACTKSDQAYGDALSMENSADPVDSKDNVQRWLHPRLCAYEGRLLIVTDRYYTSVPLAQQLRTMGFNFCGTIQKGCKDWCKGVEYSFKKRPRDFPRGEFKMAVAAHNPGMIALGWVDNKPVYVLTLQVPTELTNVTRREKNGTLTMVPCPTVVSAYLQNMGGADRHDQLRFQSYSIQMSRMIVKLSLFRKYYKGRFLGLIDMALVNGYIIHKCNAEMLQKKPHNHYQYMIILHEHLIRQASKDFTRTTAREAAPSIASRPISVTHDHMLVQSADTRVNSGVERVRQRQCKVCSIYKPSHKKRGGMSSYYCPQCLEGKRGLVTLSSKVRNYEENERLTCGQIWHITRRNGEFAPIAGHVRDRGVSKTSSI